MIKYDYKDYNFLYDLLYFQKFAQKMMQWDEIYSFEKILPILTRWQCLNFEVIDKNEQIRGIVYPSQIKKIRNPKGKEFVIYSFYLHNQETKNPFNPSINCIIVLKIIPPLEVVLVNKHVYFILTQSILEKIPFHCYYSITLYTYSGCSSSSMTDFAR